jgi:hypothetical protein
MKSVRKSLPPKHGIDGLPTGKRTMRSIVRRQMI